MYVSLSAILAEPIHTRCKDGYSRTSAPTHTHTNSTAVCVPCAGGSSCFQIPPKTLSVDKADGWLWRTAGKPRYDESFGISVGLCGYLPDIGPKSLCNTLILFVHFFKVKLVYYQK